MALFSALFSNSETRFTKEGNLARPLISGLMLITR